MELYLFKFILIPLDSPSLNLRDNEGRNVIVSGLTQYTPKTADEVCLSTFLRQTVFVIQNDSDSFFAYFILRC